MLSKAQESKLNYIKKGPIYRSLFYDGSTLLFHHAKGFASAKIHINFFAGSIYESEHEYGLAHFIEHLLFKEIKTHYVEELEGMGAEINAFTSKEIICFELSCLANKVEKCLELFMNLISKLEFTDKHFEQEKKVIFQELKEDSDDHELVGLELIYKKCFPAEYGHSVGGDLKSVKGITKEQVKKFYKKYFKPNRRIITIVSGDNSYENCRDLLSGFIKTKKEIKPVRLELGKRKETLYKFRKEMKRKMETAIVFKIFPAPTIDHIDYFSFVVLDQYLFDGLSSVFFKEFREKKPLVYGLGSDLNSYAQFANYVMTFNTQNKYVDKILNGVDSVIGKLTKDSISSEIIEKIKQNLIDNYDASFDSLEERADFITDNEIYGKVMLDRKILIKELNKINGQTISEIIDKYFDSNQKSQLVFIKK